MNLLVLGGTRFIGQAAGWEGELVLAIPPFPLPEEELPSALQLPGSVEQDLVLDTTRLREELGYREPTPPGEALRQTVAWELANPPATVDAAAFDYDREDALLAALRHEGHGPA